MNSYFSPLYGLKTSKEYKSNSAAAPQTARKLRYATGDPKHKNERRLKSKRAYTPPNIPKTINKNVHKLQENLIQSVWDFFNEIFIFPKRKGFTIVELVIVIAVIAILAAVLIPTFVNIVNKANESADIQAVLLLVIIIHQ